LFNKNQEKDERAVTIEKSSYSLAARVMGFAILVDVIYRSLVTKQASWDLLGIVILGGLVATIYQTRLKTATRSWSKVILLSVLAGLVVAILTFLAFR
jgi:hypothetical protein